MSEMTAKSVQASKLLCDNQSLTNLLDQYCQKAWFEYHDLLFKQETEVLPRRGHDGLKGNEKVIIVRVDKPYIFCNEVHIEVMVRRIKGKHTYNINVRALKIYEEIKHGLYR